MNKHMDQRQHQMIRSVLRGACQPEAPLAERTTWRIGGPAELLVHPADLSDLQTVVECCRREQIPLTVMGNGSNVLVPDDGVAGVVLQTVGALNRLTLADGTIWAESGVCNADLADFVCQRGLAGFEFLADIPGSLGGAAIMNAANNDGEFADVVLSVQWLDSNGRIHETAVVDAGFGYRTSDFKQSGHLVTAVRLMATHHDDPSRIAERMQRIAQTRRAKFPLQYPNCGSVFKRPAGHFAGRLIEAAGCKGLRYGQAQVSQLHAGFIVNLGGATAHDVRCLIAEVQQRVRQQSGVELECEVVCL